MARQPMQHVLFPMDRDLHALFKRYCRLKAFTMSRLVTLLMLRRFVAEGIITQAQLEEFMLGGEDHVQ